MTLSLMPAIVPMDSATLVGSGQTNHQYTLLSDRQKTTPPPTDSDPPHHTSTSGPGANIPQTQSTPTSQGAVGNASGQMPSEMDLKSFQCEEMHPRLQVALDSKQELPIATLLEHCLGLCNGGDEEHIARMDDIITDEATLALFDKFSGQKSESTTYPPFVA